jgi:ribokinase
MLMSHDAKPPGRVFVFGSAHQDLVLTMTDLPRAGETVLATEVVKAFGGKGANQAIAAAAAGADVTFIGTLGLDESGAQILANFAEHDIHTEWTRQTDADPTGLAVVMVDAQGRNQIVVASGAGSRFDIDVIKEVMDVVGSGDVVIVQCEIPAPVVESIITATARTEALSILNLAPFVALDSAAVSEAGIVVVNESEAVALIGSTKAQPGEQLATAVAAEIGGACIVTLGERGSVYATVAGEVDHIPARTVEAVIDTTGAGDVYVGTLGALLAGGATVSAAMAAASDAAATSVLSRGAQARHPQSTVSRH